MYEFLLFAGFIAMAIFFSVAVLCFCYPELFPVRQDSISKERLVFEKEQRKIARRRRLSRRRRYKQHHARPARLNTRGRTKSLQ